MSEAVWQDVECGAYRADLPLWRKLVREAARNGPCSLLDLGCGTGRVSLELAGADCAVTGLDLDPELIEVLRERAAEQEAPIDAVVGDARQFELGRRFDLVLAPMQLVQLLESAAERRSLLLSAARHLEPGGRLAVALLDLTSEEVWAAEPGSEPAPDVFNADGWVYSSLPVAVRWGGPEHPIELARVRRVVSPAGVLSESVSSIHLEAVSPSLLEDEAHEAALTAEPRRRIQATDLHVGSVVCVFGRRDE